MRYSFVATFLANSNEPDGLTTWVTTYGEVALAFTTRDKLEQAVATTEAWLTQRIGIKEFDAATPVELGLLIEQSGLLAGNVIITNPAQQDQIFRESRGAPPPHVVVAIEGEGLFDHTYAEWIR